MSLCPVIELRLARHRLHRIRPPGFLSPFPHARARTTWLVSFSGNFSPSGPRKPAAGLPGRLCFAVILTDRVNTGRSALLDRVLVALHGQWSASGQAERSPPSAVHHPPLLLTWSPPLHELSGCRIGVSFLFWGGAGDRRAAAVARQSHDGRHATHTGLGSCYNRQTARHRQVREPLADADLHGKWCCEIRRKMGAVDLCGKCALKPQ